MSVAVKKAAAVAKAPAAAPVLKKKAQRLTTVLDLSIPPARVKDAIDEYGLNYEQTSLLSEPIAALKALRERGNPAPRPVPPKKLGRDATAEARAENKLARTAYDTALRAWNEYKSPEFVNSDATADMIMAMRRLVKILRRQLPKNMTEEARAKRMEKDERDTKDLLNVLFHDKPPAGADNQGKFRPRGFSAKLGANLKTEASLRNPETLEARIVELQETDSHAKYFLEMFTIRKTKYRTGQTGMVAATAVLERMVEEIVEHACRSGVARERKLITAEHCLSSNEVMGDYRKLSTYALWKDLKIVRTLEGKVARRARWTRAYKDSHRIKQARHNVKVHHLREEHDKHHSGESFKAPAFVFEYPSFADSEVAAGHAIKIEHKDEKGQPRVHKKTKRALVSYVWKDLDIQPTAAGKKPEKDSSRVNFGSSISNICERVASDITALGESDVDGVRIASSLLRFVNTICHEYLDRLVANLKLILELTANKTVEDQMVLTVVTQQLLTMYDAPHGQYKPDKSHEELTQYIMGKVAEVTNHRRTTAQAKKNAHRDLDGLLHQQEESAADEEEDEEEEEVPVIKPAAPKAAAGKKAAAGAAVKPANGAANGAAAKKPAAAAPPAEEEEDGEEFDEDLLDGESLPEPVAAKKPTGVAAKPVARAAKQ
jgi:hypothetical protein